MQQQQEIYPGILDGIPSLPVLQTTAIKEASQSRSLHRHRFDFDTSSKLITLAMPGLPFKKAVVATICLATFAYSAPAGTLVASAPSSTPTAPYASENPNGMLWTEQEDITPEPIRGTLGATILGPQNVPMDLQNADLLAPPSTDSGTVSVYIHPYIRYLPF